MWISRVSSALLIGLGAAACAAPVPVTTYLPDVNAVISSIHVKGPTYNVVDYGAIPNDGKDDYDAIKTVADAVSAAGGGTVIFPPGVYDIDRYKIIAGPNANNVMNITWKNCDGLRIIGVGAKINVKGDFYRDKDNLVDNNNDGIPEEAISYSNQVVPFQINDSRNFIIQGFEINGNVDKMTRDPLVRFSEGGNSGIITVNCQNYVLMDLNVHHFEAEGILLGVSFYDPAYYWSPRNPNPDRNATIVNCRFAHNCRDGFALAQATGVICIDCTFEANGDTQGSYGSSPPSAGVNIEPAWYDYSNYIQWKPGLHIDQGSYGVPVVANGHFYQAYSTGNTGTTEPNWPTGAFDQVVDGGVVWHERGVTATERTGNVTWLRCNFRDNVGPQYQTNERLYNITLRECDIDYGTSQIYTNMYFTTGSGVLEDSYVNVRRLLSSYATQQGPSSMWIRNNYITSPDRAITSVPYSADLQGYTTVENNIIYGTHTAPLTTESGFLWFANPLAVFRNNTVDVPSAAKTDAPSQIVLTLGPGLSEGNTLRTDLSPKAGGKFVANYLDALQVKNDMLVSSPALYPLGSPDWDRLAPYSK